MIRIFLFISVLFIGMNIVLTKNDGKFRNNFQKRLSRNKEQTHILRDLMGKLIDTETNTIYSVDGQKEKDPQLNSEAISTTTPEAPVVNNAPSNREQIACLAACNFCIETYSLENVNKKAADNCGPMCDCADSCFIMSAEEVGQIYGQNNNHQKDKDCWWQTYTEMYYNALP